MTVEEFSKLYYEKILFSVDDAPLYWRGVPLMKIPTDLLSYQEIIWETKPELIVETGVAAGGSTLFLSDMLELTGQGEVIGIDLVEHAALPLTPRITYLIGRSSTNPEVVANVRRRAAGKRTMVILDSFHGSRHVLDELKAYSPLVSHGCYLIVEDTDPALYKIAPEQLQEGRGADFAVRKWNPKGRGFEVVEQHTRHMLTQNPGGYLRRIR